MDESRNSNASVQFFSYFGTTVHQRFNIFLLAEGIFFAVVAAIWADGASVLLVVLVSTAALVTALLWLALLRAQALSDAVDAQLSGSSPYDEIRQRSEDSLPPIAARVKTSTVHSILVPGAFFVAWLFVFAVVAAKGVRRLTEEGTPTWLSLALSAAALLLVAAGVAVSLPLFRKGRQLLIAECVRGSRETAASKVQKPSRESPPLAVRLGTLGLLMIGLAVLLLILNIIVLVA